MPDLSPSGPTSFIVSVAPSRAIYLVRAGSRSGFRRAVQEASTRWGGMAEPIVPVRKGGRVDGWWRQAARTSNASAVVSVDVSDDDAGRVAADLELPLVALANIDRHSEASWTVHPSVLPPATSDASPVLAATNSALWAAVAAGDVTQEHEDALASHGTSFRRVSQEDQVARAELRGATQLDQTVSAFSEYRAEGGSGRLPMIIWLTRPNSLRDCLWYWNLRALRAFALGGGPMLLLPVDQTQHWLEFARQLRDELIRPDEFNPDVVIGSATVEVEALDAAALELGLVPSTGKIRSGHKWPTTVRSLPFTYLTAQAVDPRPWFLARRQYGEFAEVQAFIHDGKASIRSTSPVVWAGAGLTTLNMRGPALDSLPKKRAVARQIINEGQWRDGGVQIATSALPTYNLELNVPSLPQALESILSATTSSYRLSDKGKLGIALRESSASLLAPWVYEAAVALATPRSKELVKELRTLRDAGELDDKVAEVALTWGGRTERRFRSAASLGLPQRARATDALERLTSMGWGERGYQLVCGQCGISAFVPLSGTDSLARCPGCHAPQQYTASKAGPDTFYRLNTLADRGVDQGVLPHLLVEAALQQRDPMTYLLPGVDVKFHGESGAPEVDVVGVHAGKLVAGEVKTNPDDFTSTQIARDIRCSRLLDADIHIMAAIGTISQAAKSEAQDACRQGGLELMVLQLSDLRPGNI